MLGKLYDVAIIGSNLSGLVAGAMLVRRTFQVLIIDVDNVRLELKRDGYTIKPFPGLFFGFGQSHVFSEIFQELGIPFLEKKKFHLAQPAYQLSMPDLRLDIPQGREEWSGLLTREFGAEAGAITNLLDTADRYSSLVRSMFAEGVVYPAFTFRERYRLNRVCGALGVDFKEGSQLDYHDLLDSTPLSPEARSFIESQFLFLSPIYPDHPSMFFASWVLSMLNKGIYTVEGGLKVLENICKERIISYRGQLQRTGEIEQIDFGRINDIILAGSKEPVRCKKILVATSLPDFFDQHLPKGLRGSHRQRLFGPPHRRHDYTLFLAIDDRVVPVGMKENVILLSQPSAPISAKNLAFVSLSPADSTEYAPEGKRLIAITTVVDPEDGELSPQEARLISDDLLDRLRDLVPFLDNYTEFVAYDESYGLYQAQRHSIEPPPIDPEDRFGLACIPNRTPHKEIFYAGKATLPGMGMEGEGMSALIAANLITKLLTK